MSDFALIFLLGFFSACLGLLLMVPAIHRRAMRLSMKKLKAAFPVSLEDIQGERDHLRAEFSLLQRRLEQDVEKARKAEAKAREEQGRLFLQRDALSQNVEHLTIQIQDYENRFHILEKANNTLQNDLSDHKTQLDDAFLHLNETKTALEHLQEEHQTLQNTLNETQNHLAGSQALQHQFKKQHEDAERLLKEREHALQEAHDTHLLLQKSLDVSATALSEETARLALSEARLQEAARQAEDNARGQAQAQEALKYQLEDAQKALLEERTHLEHAQARVKELETELQNSQKIENRPKRIPKAKPLKTKPAEPSAKDDPLPDDIIPWNQIPKSSPDFEDIKPRLSDLEKQLLSENPETLRQNIVALSADILRAAG